MYEQPLTQAGLNPEQAAVYEILLKTGPSPARKIAQNSPYKRSLIYKILDELIAVGLATKKDEVGKVSIFEPAHPLKLKELAEKQAEAARQTQTVLDSVLPSLVSDFNLISGRPGVKFYEGLEGVKKMHEEILAENKEILAFVLINSEWEKPLVQFWKQYYMMRIKKGIKVRAITENNAEGIAYQRLDQAQLRETRLVPKEKINLEIEKNIFGDKVAFLSMKPGQQMATMIHSEAVANTERAIFEMAWMEAGQNPNATPSTALVSAQ